MDELGVVPSQPETHETETDRQRRELREAKELLEARGHELTRQQRRLLERRLDKLEARLD